MRAIGVTTYGGPESLHELDVPSEPLGADEIRIAVRAAAVSPTDTLVRSGARAAADAADPPGDVPGMDVAGVVLEIGSAAETTLAVGDHAMGIVVPSGAHGGYRSDVVLPARSVTRVPAGASDEAASTLPMNGLTARLALDAVGLSAGQVLAVTGSAGAFGGYVIQLAKVAGLTVVADSTEADEALVRELGADQLVARGDGFVPGLLELYPDGVDAIADGAVLNEALFPAVRDGGVVATVRGYDGSGERGVRAVPVLVRDAAQDWAKLDELRAHVESGAVTLRVADVLPAADAAQAHQRLEAGGVRGRLVLSFE